MSDDPIIAEVRRVREQISAELNHDASAMFRDIRERMDPESSQSSQGSRWSATRRVGAARASHRYMTWSDPLVEEVDIREWIDRGEFQIVSRPPKPAEPRPVRRTGT